MEYVIDSELLILAIEKRPLLWNNQHEFYKDRSRKRDAWIEICEIFFDDLDTKEEAEKVFISKQVELKWRHIRDNYTRHVRAKTRGKIKRKYIYADQLQFLRRHIEQKFKTEEDESQETEHEVSNDGNNEADQPAEHEDSDEPAELIPRKKTVVKAHRIKVPVTSTNTSLKALPFEESLIPMEAAGGGGCGGGAGQQKESPGTEESDDMSFFRSLTPMLSSLSAQQKMRFRIDVMQQLMKYHTEQPSSNMKFDYNNE